MADNTLLNAGSGGDTLRTDDDGTAKHPVSKISLGVDGSFDGFVATTNPLPVQLSNGTALLDPVVVDDAAFTPATSSVVMFGATFDDTTPDSVDEGDAGAVRMSANRNLYVTLRDAAGNERGLNVDTNGDIGVTSADLTTLAGAVSGTEMQVDLVSANVTNAGTFAVQVDGDALTALQLIDDAVYTDATGTPSKGLAVMGTDGTNPQLVSVDASGHLQVDVLSGGGGGTQYAADDALGATPTGTVAIAQRDDALSALTPVEGDAIPLRVDANGALWVIPSGTVTVDASGTAVPITDNAGSITVDAAELTTLAGAVSGTEMQVDLVSANVTNAGTFAVQVDGAALTALQLIDDAVYTDGSGTPSKGLAVMGTDGTNPQLLAVDSDGVLQTALQSMPNGMTDSFGNLVTGTVNNQVDIQFYRSDGSVGDLVTETNANGGTATETGGMATFACTTTANSQAKGVTVETTRYVAGAEMYCLFTAAFTGTGSGTSYQRIGLYDDNDGFFVGDEGGTFGITIRKGGSDVQVAKASFSEDDLTGAATSGFKRAGTPEAIDLTKLNVYRIRFGWVGSAPIRFEVLSPDGDWVVFHRTLQPNLAAVPSIENADLPVTCDVHGGNSSAALSILTSCWGAGTTVALLTLDDTVTDENFAKLTRSVIVAKTSGGTYTNVASTNNGNFKIALDEYDGVPTGGGAESGALRVTLANDSTGLVSVDDGAGSLTVDAAELTTLAGAVSGTEMQVDVVGSLPAGTNAIGKLAANSGVDIGDVDILSQPARDRLTDNVGVALQTDVLLNDTTALTPKYAVIDDATSGNNTIVAAVAGKKLRVLALFMVAAGDVLARFEDGAGGTALTGQMDLTTNSGFVLPFNPLGWFETSANTLLNLELDAAVSCDGSLVYVEV